MKGKRGLVVGRGRSVVVCVGEELFFALVEVRVGVHRTVIVYICQVEFRRCIARIGTCLEGRY